MDVQGHRHPQAVDRGSRGLCAGRRLRACDDGRFHPGRRYREVRPARDQARRRPGMGGSQRLTRAVGKAKAMDMCLTGRMMDAVEAERASLVSRVVPAAELLDEAMKTAAAIAAMPPT